LNQDYIHSLASGFKNTDPSEVSSKILTLLIVKCFRKIRNEKAFEVCIITLSINLSTFTDNKASLLNF